MGGWVFGGVKMEEERGFWLEVRMLLGKNIRIKGRSIRGYVIRSGIRHLENGVRALGTAYVPRVTAYAI